MTRIGAVLMTVLLALYLVFSVYYASVLFGTGSPVAVAIGVALLLLALLGGAFIAAELVFGVRAERLARRLEAEGAVPTEELPALPSGRVDRAAAAEVFPRYREAAERAPGDWRAWFRLALAYDAAGDRRRARWATREAIRLSRAHSADPGSASAAGPGGADSVGPGGADSANPGGADSADPGSAHSAGPGSAHSADPGSADSAG